MKFIENDAKILINCDCIQKIVCGEYTSKAYGDQHWFVRACYTDGETSDNLHNDIPSLELAYRLRDAIAERILNPKIDGSILSVTEIYNAISKE